MKAETKENVVQEIKDNNAVCLKGRIKKELELSHVSFGEKFYKTEIEVLRLSGDVDNLVIIVSEKDLKGKEIVIGTPVEIEGQLRSYNYYFDNGSKRKLIINIFTKTLKLIDETELQNRENTNIVKIVGYICKKPIYRKTPFGREIADILLAVNRVYGKSDYLPCIAWGRNARFSDDLDIGEMIEIEGRIQSRIYSKAIDENTTEERVAYEISIVKINLLDEIK